MRVRNPNTGPYVISWFSAFGPAIRQHEEAHTWEIACYRMRQLLVEGNQRVSVAFV